MSRELTKHDELCALLEAEGYDTGWVLSGETLVIWEHEENPPAPLTRPVS